MVKRAAPQIVLSMHSPFGSPLYTDGSPPRAPEMSVMTRARGRKSSKLRSTPAAATSIPFNTDTDTDTWEQRVRALEEEGLTRSDAQAVVDAEDQRRAK
jgi:hypothetical protein